MLDMSSEAKGSNIEISQLYSLCNRLYGNCDSLQWSFGPEGGAAAGKKLPLLLHSQTATNVCSNPEAIGERKRRRRHPRHWLPLNQERLISWLPVAMRKPGFKALFPKTLKQMEKLQRISLVKSVSSINAKPGGREKSSLSTRTQLTRSRELALDVPYPSIYQRSYSDHGAYA
ncbi:hypothetical protein DACRYDRAFT_24713 [Dacryopinax primogenitus]|uniref:Uncharacterized protein n=1 Tax=Dacryopinax primogenitus (strain DJM 731) TaxID=1858805 RepID=M5FRG0_DACPD|nr:uncharacterized protein DACRYDRAFT_24713 [Dacryopinax primogenitus]EJT98253.1 hypothetical protein DACRYDRAFT_24713 [Dacryopinax primogenitus]